MNELALFAGAGGGLLATKWLLGWRTVCYVENADYPVSILKARIKDGLLDDAPIWGDVRTFDGTPWRGCVDIVTAGFPCQPFSRAGKQLAERDKRNLWPDTIRIIQEVRPEWALLENVPRLLSHAYAGRIFSDLAESGYDTWWDCVPASAIGANHQRDRLWIVATHTHSTELRNESRRSRWASREDSPQPGDNSPTQPLAHTNRDQCIIHQSSQQREISLRPNATRGSQDVAHTHGGRLQERPQLDSQAQQDPADGDPQREHVSRRGNKMANADQPRSPQWKAKILVSHMEPAERQGWWVTEPKLGRVANGVAHRVDRLKALGNGQVPAVVAAVWKLLTTER